MRSTEIIAYQLENDGICRFVYHKSIESLEVVSVDNYLGMRDFLKRSGGQQLPNNKDIHKWAKEMETQLSVAVH